MLWELTLLNMIYKNNMFSMIKPRIYKDKLIFIRDKSPKFPNQLIKANLNHDNIVTEEEILEYYGISLEDIQLKMPHSAKLVEHDEIHFMSDLYFCY
jgi:hypothetical protein